MKRVVSPPHKIGLQHILDRPFLSVPAVSFLSLPKPAELGASKGGKARAEKLSPQRRREIALKAIRARWAKRKESRIRSQEVS